MKDEMKQSNPLAPNTPLIVFGELIRREPEWEWRPVPDSDDVVFRVFEAPCWIHRMTQRLFLGIQWQRIPKQDNQAERI